MATALRIPVFFDHPTACVQATMEKALSPYVTALDLATEEVLEYDRYVRA